MKNLMILIFSTLAVLFTSCHGNAENGAQIIIGKGPSSDTIKVPTPKYGLIIDGIETNGRKLFITYRDTIKNVSVKIKYYDGSFVDRNSDSYIIKFASK